MVEPKNDPAQGKREALAARIEASSSLSVMEQPKKPGPLWAMPLSDEDQAMVVAALRSPVGSVIERLNAIAPAVESLACHQIQCDDHGVMVQVSRQACDEVVNAINAIAIDLAATPHIPAANAGLYTEGKYGCPTCGGTFPCKCVTFTSTEREHG